MADKIMVFITLQKEVPDEKTARNLFDMVKSKLSDHPEVAVSGLVDRHFDIEE